MSSRSRALTLLVVLVAIIGFAPVFLRRPLESDWYRCYVRAAERMQAGETIHVVEKCPYAYPPIMALLTVPLAQLPTSFGFAVWYAVNVIAIGLLLRSAWRLAGGPAWKNLTRRWSVVGVLGLLLVSRYFIGTLETRQFDLVIAAILLGGLERLGAGRRGGAALLGLAAGMKCTPLLFVPYLIWRGRTASAAVIVLVAVAANFLPDVCYPQQSGRFYLQDWRDEFLVVSQQVPPGTWFSGLIQNSSIAGASQRLFRYGLPTSLDVVHSAKLAAADVPQLRMVVAVASALLLAVTCWFVGRPRFTFRLRDVDALNGNKDRFAIEVSAVLALMLLLSPMTSRAHLSILLLPAFLLVRSAAFGEGRASRYFVAALFVLGPLAAKGFMGKTLGELALAWSFPTCFALTTLAGMWTLLAAARRRDDVVSEATVLGTRVADGPPTDFPSRGTGQVVETTGMAGSK